MVSQLAGLGAIALLGWLVSWLIFFALSLPYRRRVVEENRARETVSTRFPKMNLLKRKQTEPESEEP
jgi:hypothetical protein